MISGGLMIILVESEIEGLGNGLIIVACLPRSSAALP